AFFFFQAEDGIRDFHVTGVQTCALPILQERLPRRQGKRADTLLESPRFRAGYDFLLLREIAGEETGGLGDWWTRYQEVDDATRRAMIRDLSKDESGAAPRKRRRSPRKRRPAQQPGAGDA